VGVLSDVHRDIYKQNVLYILLTSNRPSAVNDIGKSNPKQYSNRLTLTSALVPLAGERFMLLAPKQPRTPGRADFDKLSRSTTRAGLRSTFLTRQGNSRFYLRWKGSGLKLRSTAADKTRARGSLGAATLSKAVVVIGNGRARDRLGCPETIWSGALWALTRQCAGWRGFYESQLANTLVSSVWTRL
jgi:hypothetical protein